MGNFVPITSGMRGVTPVSGVTTPTSSQEGTLSSIASRALTPIDDLSAALNRDRFEENYKFLLKTRTLDGVRVEEGRFALSAEGSGTRSQRKEVEQLITQLYRQAWGQLIDAEHGHQIDERALKRLNDLKAHLQLHFPAILRRQEGSHKPLAILTRTYKRAVTPNAEAGQQQQEQQEAIAEQVSQMRRCISVSAMPMGWTKPSLVAIASDPVAVAKTSDLSHGDCISSIGQDSPEMAKKYAWISLFNEALAAHLGVILGGSLDVPLVITPENMTVHAFIANQGHYGKLAREQPDLLQRLPLEVSQRFVFLQLILGGNDCHGGNVLISQEKCPCPRGIDFSKILFPNPLSEFGKLRACYLKFPCLDHAVNKEDRAFYSELDVEQTVARLEESLRAQFDTEFRDADLGPIIAVELLQLKARLAMVQEAVKMGLNQRQMLALEFPPLGEHERELLTLVKHYQCMIGVASYAMRANPRLQEHMNSHGFRKAWQAAWVRHSYDHAQFVRVIREEMKAIKAQEGMLYGVSERAVYHLATYDATR